MFTVKTMTYKRVKNLGNYQTETSAKMLKSLVLKGLGLEVEALDNIDF